ncbi:P-loop containing nucleoside triphosphate hydrolase protein [Crucibulum laeve]|uniref:RNA helicase n=1 Tax=Crucibulum laeve TaxID=68775 RepID=A0A5C3M7Z6_9AGAR|nr:P-loop containing nucleoside triphosphate hydrolase protein [Crucibulum laeve]
MSNDAIPHTEKKSKKSKKSKSEVVEDAEQVVGVQDESLSPEEVAKAEKKRLKKELKKKRKLEEAAAAAGGAEPSANINPGGENDDEAMVVDTTVPEEKKKGKKEKKEKKRKAEDREANDMLVDGEGEGEEKEKKKKRKRESADEHAAAGGESKKEKNDKKKRRKDEASSSIIPSSSLLSASSSTPTLSAPAPSPTDVAVFLTTHNITITSPPSIPSHPPILSFAALPIHATLAESFKSFKEPTPIQACTWPPALAGQDVVGIAETGSGKTLAFGIPALSRIIALPPAKPSSSSSPTSTVTTLVVAPTRELAIQTHETLSDLGKPFGIASVAVFGGVPKEPQVKMLRNANKGKDGMTTRIVVGTPGRILDLMQEGVCDLSGVNYLVLDEADRMLDKGFENDIRNIISATKPAAERQTMMFSATWPEAVRRLASTFQRDPVRVTVGSDDLTANSRVEQSVEVFEDGRSKDQRLLTTLRALSHKKTTTTGASDQRILVFALYKKEASRVEQMLSRQGYSVCALHGDMSQNARMEMLEKFKNGTTGLMVATDVAARGLDIPNVGAVINYTFPLTIEDYIHRIGRTGRGGKTGKSITFFTGDNHERSLAGEFARVLREGGFDYEGLKKFPMTIKKKEHGAYGAFFRDDIPAPKGPTKIVF